MDYHGGLDRRGSLFGHVSLWRQWTAASSRWLMSADGATRGRIPCSEETWALPTIFRLCGRGLISNRGTSGATTRFDKQDVQEMTSCLVVTICSGGGARPTTAETFPCIRSSGTRPVVVFVRVAAFFEQRLTMNHWVRQTGRQEGPNHSRSSFAR